jgi:signal transduction histidine kinase
MPAVPQSRRPILLPVLLGTIVLIAGVLAYEAIVALREREALAVRTLRDYVAFAAEELSAKSVDLMGQGIRLALDPATATPATSPYDRLATLDVVTGFAARVLPCADSTVVGAPRVFQLDLRDGTLQTSVPESAALRRWISDTVARSVRLTYRPDNRFAIIDAVPGDSDAVVVYSVKWSQLGAQAQPVAPIGVVGFLRCRSAFGVPLIREVLARRPLLPGALGGRLPNESLLAITLRDRSGRAVWGDAAASSPGLSATASLATPAGLGLEVALRADAVARLNIGAPTTAGRLPWLLALLGVSAGLLLVAFSQFRREQELTRLRSDFTSSVSHELRTPLAQILLAAETLELGRTRDERERSAAASLIVSEGRRLLRLVENILTYVKFSRGMESSELRRVRLAPLIRDVLTQWMAVGGSGARIALDLDESLWAKIDPGALTQILHNLVDNAVKFGPVGQTIIVQLSRRDLSVEIAVEDQGPGVPPADRERIWDPFVRGDGAAVRRATGTGLGLAVVRELARSMGGEARVVASAGGGARFVVAAPASAPAPAERPRAPVTTEDPR